MNSGTLTESQLNFEGISGPLPAPTHSQRRGYLVFYLSANT